MSEERKRDVAGTGSLSVESLEAEEVMEGAEPWESWETKLVFGSLAVAIVVLIIGLLLVPSSVLRGG